MSDSTFGVRLADARASAGMSQAELARRVGISKESISRYERGLVSPTAEVIAHLADTLSVSADFLLTGHDGPEPTTASGVHARLQGAIDETMLVALTAIDDHPDVTGMVSMLSAVAYLEGVADALNTEAFRRTAADLIDSLKKRYAQACVLACLGGQI